jgi:hypothetical protein
MALAAVGRVPLLVHLCSDAALRAGDLLQLAQVGEEEVAQISQVRLALDSQA